MSIVVGATSRKWHRPVRQFRNGLQPPGAAMPHGRVATVTPVPEEAATGKVAAIYEDIRRTKGIPSVPNFWRVLATNPDHLELVWSRLKTLMHPESVGRAPKLDAVTREIIALAV